MSNEPVSESEIRSRVRTIVAQAVDLSPDTLLSDVNLYRHYGLDSLGAIFLFGELHQDFGTPEPERESEFVALSTIDKITEYVLNSLV